ncbi:MAG: IclR family transcriptional regulator [Microbacterium sp.]|uniref:IclR family transcriptional regulator n=1 Tax=Microbacterium sp. TaxID=51671 RepID=UPI00271BA810|nr:IclR family transcriptional regulator [Microbacterium sp.]MDO8382590.1 IclR family transcriptional regulator [Microbacterium sp.]
MIQPPDVHAAMKDAAGTTILGRAVEILDCFDARSPTLSASDIGRRSGIPMPTAHRIITQMVSLGLLERTERKKLRVGMRLWELASRAQRLLALREVARPHLEGVHSVIGHHAQLGVRDGDDVMFVDLLSAPNAVINITRVASKLPIHSCSSGLVLLAYAENDFREDFLRRSHGPLTDRSITDNRALRRELAGVRSQGFAVSRGAVHHEAAGVAAPLRDSANEVVGTISVIVPNSHRHTSFAIPVLLAASRAISTSLGAQTRGLNQIDPTSSSASARASETP